MVAMRVVGLSLIAILSLLFDSHCASQASVCQLKEKAQVIKNFIEVCGKFACIHGDTVVVHVHIWLDMMCVFFRKFHLLSSRH